MKILLSIVIGALLIGLWLTRPDHAVEKCEKVNSVSYCNILNKE